VEPSGASRRTVAAGSLLVVGAMLGTAALHDGILAPRGEAGTGPEAALGPGAVPSPRTPRGPTVDLATALVDMSGVLGLGASWLDPIGGAGSVGGAGTSGGAAGLSGLGSGGTGGIAGFVGPVSGGLGGVAAGGNGVEPFIAGAERTAPLHRQHRQHVHLVGADRLKRATDLRKLLPHLLPPARQHEMR